jgi:hypothetical protein
MTNWHENGEKMIRIKLFVKTGTKLERIMAERA